MAPDVDEDRAGEEARAHVRIRDLPDDPEEWPDLEDEFIPDMRELPMSSAFGPAFTYLHAARVTLDAGLLEPTWLLTRTSARLVLATAEQEGMDPGAGELAEVRAVAAGDHPHESPEDLLDALAALSAFVETRIQVPDKQPSPGGEGT